MQKCGWWISGKVPGARLATTDRTATHTSCLVESSTKKRCFQPLIRWPCFHNGPSKVLTCAGYSMLGAMLYTTGVCWMSTTSNTGISNALLNDQLFPIRNISQSLLGNQFLDFPRIKVTWDSPRENFRETDRTMKPYRTIPGCAGWPGCPTPRRLICCLRARPPLVLPPLSKSNVVHISRSFILKQKLVQKKITCTVDLANYNCVQRYSSKPKFQSKVVFGNHATNAWSG